MANLQQNLYDETLSYNFLCFGCELLKGEVAITSSPTNLYILSHQAIPYVFTWSVIVHMFFLSGNWMDLWTSQVISKDFISLCNSCSSHQDLYACKIWCLSHDQGQRSEEGATMPPPLSLLSSQNSCLFRVKLGFQLKNYSKVAGLTFMMSSLSSSHLTKTLDEAERGRDVDRVTASWASRRALAAFVTFPTDLALDA